ncbi:YgaP family membrane protein [Gemmobacter serpentinus]|uniref:YgaP family membrane protein n=1 Tax=Gemmobacter serpentinus TaxID=2652247 RepID=UPI00124C8186|nr:DUF2892 domain-containing protein [Gemmobacter serpentinus]
MCRNLGSFDRILRLVVGLATALLAWTWGAGWPVLGPVLWVIAVILILTAAAGRCPAYRLFGLSTCPMKK